MTSTGNATCQRLGRAWLVGILFFLPFQITVAGYFANWNLQLANVIYYLDEITGVTFSILAFVKFNKNRQWFNTAVLNIFSSLTIFISIGVISTIINYNHLNVSVLGIFDYAKNFLAIFIYAAFFRSIDDFKFIFRYLLIIAIIFTGIASMQFIWAMGSVYIFEKEITDQSVYLFSDSHLINPITLKNVVWRYGLFRADAIVLGAYILGLFNLLILTIYYYTARKIKLLIMIPLIIGIISSVSRMAYGGLCFLLLIQLIKKRSHFIILLVTVILASSFIITSGNLNLGKLIDSYIPAKENIDKTNMRTSSRYTALEIWKKHPLFGVGPGRFGGIVASKYPSPVYNEYAINKRPIYKRYILKVGGIEQFWFQILAELGLVGVACFIAIFLVIGLTLRRVKELSSSSELSNIMSALIVFIGCIAIYCLGSGINIASVFFTYCAFVGIGLGIVDNEYVKTPPQNHL